MDTLTDPVGRLRAVTRVDWTPHDIPDLTDRRALVTGVTSGVGEYTALELARKGAEVVMAGRSEERLSRAVADVQREVPDATMRPLLLDLADLDSVRRAAAEAASYGPLDILVNNAGVMATPHRRTRDGFELQLGTNHLGHFALTGLLLPQLVAAGTERDRARVVTVTSGMHRFARRVPTGDPRIDHGGYSKWRAYARSKLANLLFTFELDRRARATGLPVTSVAAHPGLASTNLVDSGVNLAGTKPDGALLLGVFRLVGQSPARGAWPSLMAATAPDLPGGTFVGPRGPFELNGAPVVVQPSRAARDAAKAGELWALSEQATGVAFP